MQFTNLPEIFKEFSEHEHNGVKGVVEFDSGQAGPVVGFTIMTHGNEPAGLAVFEYFRKNYPLKEKLLKGKVICVLNNIEAGQQYFEIVTTHNDVEAKRKTRFVDVNMNRLPDNVLTDADEAQYEVRRSRELLPVWKQFDYALDIHSTSQPTDPMIIALERSSLDLIRQFPFEVIISNIEAVQIGIPACYHYGTELTSVFGLEVGGHEENASIARAIDSSLLFLYLLGMVAESTEPVEKSQVNYRVFGSISFPNESYELLKVFTTFEPVTKGQVIARGDGESIVAPQDCYVLFGPAQTKPANLGEEVLFFAELQKL